MRSRDEAVVVRSRDEAVMTGLLAAGMKETSWRSAPNLQSEMHWLTLAFHDRHVEQAFCIEESRQALRFGKLSNTLVVVTAVASYYCRSSLHHWTVWALPVCMASVGVASTLPIIMGIGSPSFQYSVLVKLNVASLCVGCCIWVLSIVLTNPSGSVDSPMFSDAHFLCINAPFIAVIVTGHVLAFPFWARCVIAAVLNLSCWLVVFNLPVPLAASGAAYAIFITAAVTTLGELVGTVLHCACRRRFLAALSTRIEREALAVERERLLAEKRCLKQEKQHFEERVQQLQGEKERVEYERLLIQKSMAVMLKGSSRGSTASDSLASNEELKGILPSVPSESGSGSSDDASQARAARRHTALARQAPPQ